MKKALDDNQQAVQLAWARALFNLCVQQNSLDKALAVIKQRCKHEPPTTQRGLLEIAVVERGKKASSDWASDCISRRMGILSGGACESTEHELPSSVKTRSTA